MSGQVMLRLSAQHVAALKKLSGGRPHSRIASEIVDEHLRAQGFDKLPPLRSAGAQPKAVKASARRPRPIKRKPSRKK